VNPIKLRSSGQEGPGYHDCAGSQKEQTSGGGRVGPAFRRLRVSAGNGTIIDILHELKRTAQPSSASESKQCEADRREE